MPAHAAVAALAAAAVLALAAAAERPSGAERDLPEASASPVRAADPSADAASEPRFADFLGAEACARCHPAEYDVWRRSTHGRAGGRPGEVEILAPFRGERLVFRDAVVTARRDGAGKPVFEVRGKGGLHEVIEVAAVVGGGHLAGGGNQTYFAEYPDGTLRFLPFDWSARRGWFVQRRDDLLWVPITPELPLAAAHNWPPHRVLGNDPLSEGCLDCHGSQIQRVRDPATGRPTTRWVSLAITCESCHGPGRRHVEIVESPGARARQDIGMAPLELAGTDESIRLCLGCHADKTFLTDGWLPGKSLEDHYALKLEILRHQTFTPDGKVVRFGYQDNHLLSDCYANGAMTCTDCHDPHSQGYRDVFGRPLAGRFDDGQCTGCHASQLAEPALHTHHAPDSPGSRCVACHMPYLQQKGIGTWVPYERADHTVSIPRPALDASFGIDGACRRCHADVPVAELQSATERWWGPLEPIPWYTDAILRAREERDLGRAAELLLRPDVAHPSAQILALTAFLETRVEPGLGSPPDPEVVGRLRDLASSPDLDLTAIALATLDVVAGDDPDVRRFLTERSAALGARGPSVRARWALVLDHLASRIEARGDRDRAREVRARLAALSRGSAK